MQIKQKKAGAVEHLPLSYLITPSTRYNFLNNIFLNFKVSVSSIALTATKT